MDRISHVKIASPDPDAIRRFLLEIVDIPDGGSMGAVDTISPRQVASPARDENGDFTRSAVLELRGGSEPPKGFIIGNGQSGGLQVVASDTARIWGVAIGTRDVEGAHERCAAAVVPATEIYEHDWGDGTITFFYAEVGGVVFEILRINS